MARLPRKGEVDPIEGQSRVSDLPLEGISVSGIRASNRGCEGAPAYGRVDHRHRLRSGGLPNTIPLGGISRAYTPVVHAHPTARLVAGRGGSAGEVECLSLLVLISPWSPCHGGWPPLPWRLRSLASDRLGCPAAPLMCGAGAGACRTQDFGPQLLAQQIFKIVIEAERRRQIYGPVAAALEAADQILRAPEHRTQHHLRVFPLDDNTVVLKLLEQFRAH